MPTARIVAFLGIATVALILCAVAALTIVNLTRTTNGQVELSRSVEVGNAYAQMTIAIALASLHSEHYQESRDSDDRSAMIEQIQKALANDAIVKRLGTEADRLFMTEMETRYARELANASRLLGGADLTNDELALQTDFDALTESLAAPSLQARARAVETQEAFKQGLQRRSNGVLAAFVAAIPLLGILGFVILRYERVDAIRADELKKLGQAVLKDSLTGLRNHRSFQEDLAREFSQASRNEQPLSVALLDIDGFKEVNDSSGHARGDAVLTEFGRLMALLRNSDQAYRVGGDEFALVLPGSDADSALAVVERLRLTTEKAIPGVTISAGVSSLEPDDANATRLRDRADLALYAAKHRGKNQVVGYEPEFENGNAVTADKMTALRCLLKNRDVTMWFQPIFRLGSGDVLAFEALLRLPHSPQLAGPEEAFEIAQHMGLSRDLDLLCVTGALREASDLPKDARIFINLDPATLIHSDFDAHDLLLLTLDHGIEPGQVVFEVTEKTAAPLSRLSKQVALLQELGFGVALDDVGAGNSGLEMLRVMRFDYVKIDRSVIIDAMDAGPGRAVVLAIAAFARETGACIIAEGIESREMLDGVGLGAAGMPRFSVQAVQGYLFGVPRASIAGCSWSPEATLYAGRTVTVGREPLSPVRRRLTIPPS